ncbi:hypothetical protein OIDMADRAFT_165466 [Oidiodendron maius Zn]|uniref:H/ACA ribonucleoprotein complex subunit NOP10 n=1 Tax=Oidiodendron maius (strain Zn) TaxID=913774 RepID=A0A0C3CKF3_OIDMZ|nr:hypothetical protein OIDMADRAFT_165466 [Oidiodendron maius Zn]
MHLMYTIDANGKRIYTLHKVVAGEVTKSAHPARFSPDDKYSRHRVTLKKRYGLLLTQQSESDLLRFASRYACKNANMSLCNLEDLKVLGQ